MNARQMRRAARSLEKWAGIIRSSNTVLTIGHPREGKFDDDRDGKADEAEYNAMTEDAKALRKLAKRGSA